MPLRRKALIICLIFLVLFSLGIRLYRIDQPPHKYFDEVYHVVTAEAYSRNDPTAYDPFAPAPEKGTAYDWLHPPLAKLVQAGSINILGDTPFAWRLPSAIFGTGIVLATFFLAYFIFGLKVAVFSSIVIAFENLNLVLSRITMNDVFVTFFIIVSFTFGYLYLKNNLLKFLILTAIFLGLSVASKWTGFYAIGAIFGLVVFKKLLKRKIEFRDLLLLVIPALIYLLSYGQFWLQGHTWKQFADLHKQIWWYQNKHDLEHSYGTTPIYCVPKGLDGQKTFCPWVLDIRPVYYSYEQYDKKAGYIYALGNPLIFWVGFVAVFYLTLKNLKSRDRKTLFILLGYFIFWVPWILTPRIMFLSHYLPSIPFMAILLGFVLSKLHFGKYKYLVYLLLAFFVFTFFYFYPISTGYPIEVQAISKYMWISSWR